MNIIVDTFAWCFPFLRREICLRNNKNATCSFPPAARDESSVVTRHSVTQEVARDRLAGRSRVLLSNKAILNWQKHISMQQGWLLKIYSGVGVGVGVGWGGGVNHSDVMLRRLKAVKDTGRFQSADVPGRKNIFCLVGNWRTAATVRAEAHAHLDQRKKKVWKQFGSTRVNKWGRRKGGRQNNKQTLPYYNATAIRTYGTFRSLFFFYTYCSVQLLFHICFS